ncbi:MAG TPA: cupin domain-containing protein [Vicinamibacterales bacterium]|jgi:quercetin dioxygenase-like cupin family protein
MSRQMIVAAVAALSLAAAVGAQGDKPQGTTYRSPGGTTLRLMLDETNLGAEASVGEMIFPPNTDSGDHQHGAIEIFYVVSGQLEHVVNGRSQFLKPGMSGFVRPPDKVRHKTGPAGAKVVVMWVPGEEGRKLASRWQREP